MDDEIVVKDALKSDKEMLDKIDFTKNSLSSNPLYIVCGKVNPKCEKIISDFNKGFEIIKSNGEFDKILSSYGLK
ncbi:MAG: hypothetical protein BWY78_00784 [Alphaproteobacteria bacterium ADurb.Bin438]|nr:MAG: hypothetical protein BWY78_00784 [Alphaproteobacteria bacterium ADurb.Bin438]